MKNQNQPIACTTKHIACDGGGGALGHPKVWLEMGDDNFVICKYCDKHFIFTSKETASH